VPRSKLTLYIFIALILGVAAGYWYNVRVISSINTRLSIEQSAIKNIDHALTGLKDTTTTGYKTIDRQRPVLRSRVGADEAIIDHKLEGFSILSDIFLRLIKMIVGPLVFASLVAGVAKIDNIKSVGRIGGKTLLWFFGATLISLLLGMLLVNLFGPGKDIHFVIPYNPAIIPASQGIFSLKDFVSHILPESFIDAMAHNQMLQIVVFALFFGVGTAAIGEKGRVVTKFFEAVTQVLLKITGYIMRLAPLAVFGAMAAIIARQGLSIISTYVTFIGEFYFSLLLLWLVIIMAGYLIINRRVFSLVGRIKDAILTAFGTSTSEAAYPKLFTGLEEFGCSNKIVSFVLPLGYSFNLDGGMMYMTFASLFIAQACGVHLSLSQQLSMLLMLMLASKGLAGVPRAALVVVAATISQFNIPEAGFALIIGIDPLLDMGRSATNVLGNAVATAVVCKWEGELGDADV